MSKTNISFEEKVRGTGKKPDSNDYNVIFRTRAAFYWIKGDRTEELKILEEAAKNKTAVKITCDGITREIFEVKE